MHKQDIVSFKDFEKMPPFFMLNAKKSSLFFMMTHACNDLFQATEQRFDLNNPSILSFQQLNKTQPLIFLVTLHLEPSKKKQSW